MANADKITLTVSGKSVSLDWLLKDANEATYVWVDGCPGLTALPDLPAATYVRVSGCPGLTELYAGEDRRGFQFYAVKIRGAWHVVAGCRNLDIAQARAHWGVGGPSENPECLALVEKLVVGIATTGAAAKAREAA